MIVVDHPSPDLRQGNLPRLTAHALELYRIVSFILKIPGDNLPLLNRIIRMEELHPSIEFDIGSIFQHRQLGFAPFSVRTISTIDNIRSRVPGMDGTKYCYNDGHIEITGCSDGLFGIRIDLNERPGAVVSGIPLDADSFMITQLQGANQVIVTDSHGKRVSSPYVNPLAKISDLNIKLLEAGISMAEAHGFRRVAVQSGSVNPLALHHTYMNTLIRGIPGARIERFDINQAVKVYDRTAERLGFTRESDSLWVKVIQ